AKDAEMDAQSKCDKVLRREPLVLSGVLNEGGGGGGSDGQPEAGRQMFPLRATDCRPEVGSRRGSLPVLGRDAVHLSERAPVEARSDTKEKMFQSRSSLLEPLPLFGLNNGPHGPIHHTWTESIGAKPHRKPGRAYPMEGDTASGESAGRTEEKGYQK
ncbi:hypothetical protein KUCAC02_033222, partial [Chaenocephalus aceratus]